MKFISKVIWKIKNEIFFPKMTNQDVSILKHWGINAAFLLTCGLSPSRRHFILPNQFNKKSSI